MKVQSFARTWLIVVVVFFVPKVINAEVQPSRTYFLVTVDVETSAGCGYNGCFPGPIEDRILGKRGDSYYGISLMMDILDKHGMKATFFVNAYLDSYYPEDEVREIVRNIVERGHDVQLHTHEEFRCFATCEPENIVCWQRCTKEESFLSGNTVDNQVTILEEGARNIEKWSGRYPIAFRGGGFDADFNTLKALEILNIPVDSSLSRPSHTLASVYPINKVGEHEGVIEVPLFNYKEDLIVAKPYRHLDIESTTLLEFRKLLGDAIENDVRTVVLLMHSFSFCRSGFGCPIQQNIERFDNLLAHIGAMPQVEVITFTNFYDIYQEQPERFLGEDKVPSTNYFHTLHRSFVRFDQGIKNKIFLLTNITIFIGLALVMITIGVKWYRFARSQ